ncbi:MAG: hypothetical protein AAF927_31675 [Bacteroidota bacterium]
MDEKDNVFFTTQDMKTHYKVPKDRALAKIYYEAFAAMDGLDEVGSRITMASDALQRIIAQTQEEESGDKT